METGKLQLVISRRWTGDQFHSPALLEVTFSLCEVSRCGKALQTPPPHTRQESPYAQRFFEAILALCEDLRGCEGVETQKPLPSSVAAGNSGQERVRTRNADEHHCVQATSRAAVPLGAKLNTAT